VKDPPVVLYLYNYTLDTDLFRNDGWCKRATQGGFAAVGFVSALAGQRYAYRPMKEWFVSELQESLGTTVHDVQMILNYLERRGDLDVSQVGMFGQGSGGAIAVLAAEADPRISALDVLNPWGDWPDWLKDSPQVPEKERAAYLTPEFLKRVENLDPILYLPKLNLKALRVEQVLDDLVTPAVAKQKIAASVQRPEQLVQYKDIFAEQDAWRVSGLSGWLHEQLRPSPPTQSGPGSQSVAPAVAGQNSSSAPQLKAVQ
jgi:pimeloyl-ACP methyl ester carboxylesterase